MPTTLGDRISFSQTMSSNEVEGPLKLSRWSVDHPIFKALRDESATEPSADFPEFYSAFSMEPEPTANVIASFDKDIPAIVEDAAGWGRIMLFNTSPDTKISDLPLRPVFLPLMQQTIFYLVSVGTGLRARPNDRNILVGDTYTQHVQENIDSPPKLFDPENNSAIPALSASERGSQIQYGPVRRAGIYRLEFKTEGRLRRDYFAVNLDTTDESDLKAAEDGEVISKLGERARFVSLDDTPKEIVRSTRSGSEVSSRLLIAAAILMLVEIPLANRRRI
jgi:hypothetical protein